MNTTNNMITSTEQFISTLASLHEYANPAIDSKELERMLMAIFYGTRGSADQFELVDLLRSAESAYSSREADQATLANAEIGPF